jgi:CRP/FNR family transcriptional regulator
MRENDADLKSSTFDVGTACADCPAFELNLCHALAQAAKQGPPMTLRPSEHTVAARRLICRARDVLEVVPIICQGWAASAVTLPDGRRQILSFLLPGDVVSTALIFDPVSQCSVEAITEVRYRAFKRTEFKAALHTHPSLFDKFSRVWVDEKASANQLAIDLGRRTADERIARLIFNLSNKLAQRSLLRDWTMDFPLRQHQIADATGLTVVHVGTVLSGFRRAGLLDINDRSLTISDPAGLRRVANM